MIQLITVTEVCEAWLQGSHIPSLSKCLRLKFQGTAVGEETDEETTVLEEVAGPIVQAGDVSVLVSAGISSEAMSAGWDSAKNIDPGVPSAAE